MATFIVGLVCLVVGAVGGFVFGALFTRKNKAKVDEVVNVVK